MAYWGNDDPTWQRLTGPQRAAAMALLEAEVGQGGIDATSARNALGAIINRAESEGQPLSDHVSRRIYQPIIEDNQRSRLQSILQSPEFQELSTLAERRASGEVPDWVGGADHYLAPPQTMLALEAKDPRKYRSWRNWTQFDPETNQYGNVVMTDKSHHFLDLLDNEGVKNRAAPLNYASASAMPTGSAEPRNEDRTMLPFLTQLLGMSGGAGGPWAAALETAGGGGAPAAAGGSSGGVLSDLFGGQGGGNIGGQVAGNLGGNAGTTLAQGAQANAQQAATGGPLAPLQRTPVNTQNLQALLARKPMLGYGMRGAV